MQNPGSSYSKLPTSQLRSDHQKLVATQCLNAVPLDGLDPSSEVEAALREGSLSDTHITQPCAGDVYVYPKGKQRWSDGMKWPFSKEFGLRRTKLLTEQETHRNASNKQDYNIYHGVTREGHLSALRLRLCREFTHILRVGKTIRVNCTVHHEVKAYGVVYYIKHNEDHVRSQFLLF